MNPNASDLDHPLWRYSLQIYSQTEVAAQCLHLQDTFGLNVNLLLLGAWAATQGRSLSHQHFLQLQGAIASVDQSTVQPLRKFRRQLLSNITLPETWHAELKQRLLATELYAEQIEQALLYQTFLNCNLNGEELLQVAASLETLMQENLQTYAEIVMVSDRPIKNLELGRSLETLAALLSSAH